MKTQSMMRRAAPNERQNHSLEPLLLGARSRQDAGMPKRLRTRVPLVPIHSWSCSSLKVSLTFPPDLLYMPDKGTVGRRSWRHKSTVRKGGAVGQREGDETELEAMIIGILDCGTKFFFKGSKIRPAYLGTLNRWHHIFRFSFVQHFPVLLQYKSDKKENKT